MIRLREARLPIHRAAGLLIRSPGALAPGLAVLGLVFKCCRPLGQQMKAYHSVMPAAVTRRPLADMKKGAGPKPTVRNEEAPEIVLSTGASSVTRLAIRARLVGLWAVGAYLRSKFGAAGKVPKRSPGAIERTGAQVWGKQCLPGFRGIATVGSRLRRLISGTPDPIAG
jgi:hypothetical protein